MGEQFRCARSGLGAIASWVIRGLGALLLLVMAAVHLLLWARGGVPLLGSAFLVNAVGGLGLALAVIVVRGRPLALVAAGAMVFTVGTLAALVLGSSVGLFGVHEERIPRVVPASLIAEDNGVLHLSLTDEVLHLVTLGG